MQIKYLFIFAVYQFLIMFDPVSIVHYLHILHQFINIHYLLKTFSFLTLLPAFFSYENF